MGEAQSTRRVAATSPVDQVAPGTIIRRTINGKVGPWRVLGKMQTSAGSWAFSVAHVSNGTDESFVVGPKASLTLVTG